MTKYREILRLKNQGSYSTLASQEDMEEVKKAVIEAL